MDVPLSYAVQTPVITVRLGCVGIGTDLGGRANPLHAKHADSDRLNDLSRRVISRGFTVPNAPSAGFLEKVYEHALGHELRLNGLAVEQQARACVVYRDLLIGEYYIDQLVENVLLAELKAVEALGEAHRPQCVNYLKATGLPLCLLLNFARPRLETKRVVNGL